MSVITQICRKILTPASYLSRSLKVTGTDLDQSATYDFLLLIYSNRGLSGTVSEINGDLGQKLQILPTFCIF